MQGRRCNAGWCEVGGTSICIWIGLLVLRISINDAHAQQPIHAHAHARSISSFFLFWHQNPGTICEGEECQRLQLPNSWLAVQVQGWFLHRSGADAFEDARQTGPGQDLLNNQQLSVAQYHAVGAFNRLIKGFNSSLRFEKALDHGSFGLAVMIVWLASQHYCTSHGPVINWQC